MALVVRIALVAGLLLASGRIANAQSDSTYWNLERLELSGFFGVHISSNTSALGARADSTASIANSVTFGPRLTYLFHPWLLLEVELPLAPSSARDTDQNVNVLVIEPRIGTRLEIARWRRFVPFATAGLGIPISLSGNSQVIRNDISVRPHLGGGVLFLRSRDWNLRLDARLIAASERGDALVTPEFETALSLYYSFGNEDPRPSLAEWTQERDSDGDGIPDRSDQCPVRDEDRDSYEDLDGCPDIDNDLDLVLDIADRCPIEPETHNGYGDEDGCPDTVPPEVLAMVGVVKGLRFRARSARLNRSGRRTLRRFARIMAKHNSVRIMIAGHTDNRESRKDLQALSLRRARAVRDFLIKRKIRPWRIKIEGRADRDPRSSNRSRRGRAKNRRVEITLRVYGP